MKKLHIPMLVLMFLLFGITCDAVAYTSDVSYFFDGVKLDTGAVYRDQTTLIVVFGEPEFLPDIADVIRPGVPRPGDFFLDVPSTSDGLVDVLFAEIGSIDGYLTFAETMFDAVNHDQLAHSPLNTDLSMVTIQPDEILAVRTMDNIWYKVMFTATPQWGTLTTHWEKVSPDAIGAVPEPGTLVLLGLGLLGIVTIARTRKSGARTGQVGMGLLLVCSLSLLPVAAQAKTIFADHQLTQNCVGNYAIAARSCTGSDGDAYPTIQQAIDAISEPGVETYEINIRSGIYKHALRWWVNPAYPFGLLFNQKEGTAEHPIIVQKYPMDTERPQITWEDNVREQLPSVCWEQNCAISLITAYYSDYITFDGLDIQGFRPNRNDPEEKNAGLHCIAGMGTMTLRNSKIHECGTGVSGIKTIEHNEFSAIGSSRLEHGIYDNQDGLTIRYNVFHDIVGFAIHNYSSSLQPSRNAVIANNIIYDVCQSNEIGGDGAIVTMSNNAKIFNNTIDATNCSYYGIGLYVPVTGVELKNNIIVNAPLYALWFKESATNSIVQNNLFYNNGEDIRGICNNCTISNNIQGQNPQFVASPPSLCADFRLQAGSPAIDAGQNIGNAFDIGFAPDQGNCPPIAMLDQDEHGLGWEIGAFVAPACVQFDPLTLFAPSGTITNVTPTFTWRKDPQADAYWFWLQIEHSPTALYTVQNHPAAGNCDADTCRITPPVTLQSGVTYHWWVSPRQTGCNSEVWGDGLQFTVTNSASCEQPIVFESDRDGDREIFSMCQNGSNLTQLTQNSCVDGRPSLSPDGQKVAFVSNCDGNDDIYTMHIDGSHRQRLTTAPGPDWWPMWSPDGKQIVFDSIRLEHARRRQIYIMQADGSNQHRVSNSTKGEDADAAWSSDGKRLTFWSTRGDGSHLDIYTMSADGSDIRQLTANLALDASPAYSPDGTKIVFHSSACAGDSDAANGFDLELCVMNTDGSGQIKLTDNGFHDTHPRWSQDGKQIVFVSARDENNEVYIMDANGSNQRRVTNNPSHDSLPDWGISASSPRQIFTIKKAGNAAGKATITAGNLFCDTSCQELQVPVTPNSALVIQAIPSPLANVSVRWEKPDGKPIPSGMLQAQPGDTVIAVFEKQ